MAFTGDLDCGNVIAQPVAVGQEEVINLGALMVKPGGSAGTSIDTGAPAHEQLRT